MKHQCVICGEPMKGDDSEVGIFQMQNNLTEHRSVPSHKQCNVRWGKHEEWKKDGTGKNEFTSEEVAEIEARMDNYPWEPVEL